MLLFYIMNNYFKTFLILIILTFILTNAYAKHDGAGASGGGGGGECIYRIERVKLLKVLEILEKEKIPYRLINKHSNTSVLITYCGVETLLFENF